MSISCRPGQASTCTDPKSNILLSSLNSSASNKDAIRSSNVMHNRGPCGPSISSFLQNQFRG